MSIGIYCRISKNKEEGKDVSISVQRQKGIEFAKSIGQDYKVFIDEGISGASKEISDRPAFTKLITGIEDGEINTVYCYDQSRIERNNIIWNLFVSIVTEHNCKYYPGGQCLDLDVPENQFFSGIMSLANALYAAKTGIKVKETIYENAKKGKAHGLVAYGYQKDSDGFFEPHVDEAIIVKRIFDLSLDGNGTYTIAKMLNAERIPTKFNQFKGRIKRVDKYTNQVTTFEKNKVKWRGNVIHDIIKNPIYKGKRKWGDEYFSVPAIIDEELWKKVNENLVKNKKKAGKRAEYHYLLNGIFYCGHCGSKILGKKRLKHNDNAYKCQGKTQHKLQCKARGLSLPKLESLIIRHLFISHDLQNFLINVADEKDNIDLLIEKLDKTQKELSKNQKAEELAYDRLLDPYFENDEKIKQRLEKIKLNIKNLQETIDIIQNRIIEKKSGSRIDKLKTKTKDFNTNVGFDKIKELIHSIIKKLTLEHYLDDNDKGYYLLKVEYQEFDDYNVFKTDWKAFNWIWVGQYRKNDEVSNLRDNADELVRRPYSKIVLDSEDLFTFD